MRRKSFIIIFLLFLYINVKAQSYSTKVEVVSSGGIESSGGNYSNFGVLGETFTGFSVSGGNYSSSMGFISTGICFAVSIRSHPKNQTVCEGADVNFSVTATGTGLTYQWQKNGENIIDSTNSTLNFVSVSLNDAASYSVIVSGECGDTITSDTAGLIVNALPVISISGNNPVCAGAEEIYNTTTNPDYSYEWAIDGGNITSGENTNEINVAWADSSEGSVYLQGIVDSTGCISDTTVQITINPLPVIQSIFGESTACTNTSLTYGVADIENSFLWQASGGEIGNDTINMVNILWEQAGEQEVRLTETNSFGCAVESIFSVNVADGELLDNPEIKLKFGALLIGTNLLDAFASYQWYNEEGAISGATGQFYELPLPLSGEYYLIATDNNNCKAESNHLVFDGSESYSSILAYPNPVSEELSILFPERDNGSLNILLFNNTGQAVIINSIKNGNYLEKINTADLMEGMYFLIIESKGEVIYSEKIIVQH